MTTLTCNLDTFLSMFANESDAIKHILDAHEDERVETTEYTIPYYAYVGSMFNTPRYQIDRTPQTYSHEVRITNLDDDDIVVVFPRVCYKSSAFFNKHLINRLCDQSGEFKEGELNITEEYELERTALVLQREITHRRINKTRIYMIHGDLTPQRFEADCQDIAAMLEENKRASERINQLIRVTQTFA